jgi:hypothetical protein
MIEAKQVLVMKHFPKADNMPTGKYVSQGSHASVGALLSIGHVEGDKFVIPLADPFVNGLQAASRRLQFTSKRTKNW